MTETINTTASEACSQTIETQKRAMSNTEICFGALMGIGAIAGMWGAVSLLISYFIR